MAPLILSFLLFADAAAPAPDLDYRLKFEVVLAQRKFMEVQPTYAAALKEMQAKTAEANKVCEKQGKMFSEMAVTCVEKPAQPGAAK